MITPFTHTVPITNWFYDDYIKLYLFQIKYNLKMTYKFFETVQAYTDTIHITNWFVHVYTPYTHCIWYTETGFIQSHTVDITNLFHDDYINLHLFQMKYHLKMTYSFFCTSVHTLYVLETGFS